MKSIFCNSNYQHLPYVARLRAVFKASLQEA